MLAEPVESSQPFTWSVTNYHSLVANMLGDLKHLREYAEKLALSEVVTRADEVVSRIESEFFTVVVVGEFRRGKSTLINALLGREILPADILPTTAALNRVTYGLTPRAQVVFKARNGEPERTEEVAVDRLVEYVTKLTPEAEVTAADVKEAVIHYPVKYCKDNADIVDTPGLNDEFAMDQVTYSVLPKADAAILVIMATAPFSLVESEFLNRMLINDLGRVMFVVNRIDEIPVHKRPQLYAGIEARIDKAVRGKAAQLYGEGSEDYELFVKRIGRPRVFGVASRAALEAKLAGDDGRLANSGFPEFESALERFLLHDRGAVSLQVLADCSVAAGTKILHTVNLQEGAARMSLHEFEDAYRVNSASLDDLRRRYQDEMAQIDRAARRALERARPFLGQLQDGARQAAAQAIDEAPVAPEDLNKQRQADLMKKLGERVSQAVRSSGQLTAERMQLEIQRELEGEIGRLMGFADEMGRVLGQIEMQFSGVKAGDASQLSKTDLTAATVLGAYWGMGGLLTGYREAGFKGALVGGVAGLGAGMGVAAGAGILIGILGLPLTWPVLLPAMIGAGLASAFGGQWAARLIFGKDRAEKFKQNYKQSVFAEIDKQFDAQRADLERKLEQQVSDAFDALKRHTQLELGGSIEQTQRTLDELRGKMARSEAVQELELAELAQMRLGTHKIQERAHARSKELREIRSV